MTRSEVLSQPAVEGPAGTKAKHKTRFSQTSSMALLLVVVVTTSAFTPGFLSFENLLNIARSGAITGIIAAGMTLVIISGGIDLSVGATAGLGGVVTAGLMYGSYGIEAPFKLPVVLAVIVGLLIGAAIGFANGLLITKTGIEPFMATLGSMIFVRGLIYFFTGGNIVLFTEIPPQFAFLGQESFLGLPILVFIFGLVVIFLWWILRRATFGRSLYAIGGNEEASRLSGIDITKTKILVYTLIGSLAALAGIVMVSRLGSAGAFDGLGYEFTAIAGVVIGGTSLAGGRGSVIGTVVGIFIIGTLQNALTLLGVSTEVKYLATGVVLLFAISVDGFIRKRK
jgi:ribose/xylose/arabinose/galactoside ABC-type transport system permease subunit